jgi:hypothetical protein
MKWPRYRRVISIEIQVGISSQIDKWASTDPGNTFRPTPLHSFPHKPETKVVYYLDGFVDNFSSGWLSRFRYRGGGWVLLR